MNISALRNVVRPLTGLAVTAALLGVPVTAASAADRPTVGATSVVASANGYCDDSGYGCAGYGYGANSGWDYSDSGNHHRGY